MSGLFSAVPAAMGAFSAAKDATGTTIVSAGWTVAAGSRARLRSVTGNPAAGAHYQPSNALRRKKNGEELIGDAQAVVAVLGEPARPQPAKPEAT